MADKVFIQDSAVVEASIDFDNPEDASTISSVTWQVVKPDNTNVTIPGAGVTSSVVDLEAVLSLAGTVVDQVGLWRARAIFNLSDGTTRSTLTNFEVIDPLATISLSTDNTLNWVIDHAYLKLEDLFDSELGGPWLSDKTVKNFSREKMSHLVPDALYYVNNESQPITGFDETSFPLQQHKPLLAQALLVETIYHLMRSYVEQPLPIGQQITYFDRRDYLTRWSTVLMSEEKKLQGWIDMFKLQYTGFGSSALLVGGYASSLARTPAAYRTRYPKFITPYRALF